VGLLSHEGWNDGKVVTVLIGVSRTQVGTA
jgi:hypothetical protein